MQAGQQADNALGSSSYITYLSMRWHWFTDVMVTEVPLPRTRQLFDNYTFLESTTCNPAGVKIMGILVDYNVAIRCAGLAFTSFT